MQQRWFGFLVLAVAACGGSNSGDEVKTPDQILAEQERLGDEQLQREKNAPMSEEGTTDEEKRREWDDKQAELELHRAAHSAETCPESVAQAEPPPDPKAKKTKAKPAAKVKDTKASVTLTFANDGHVKELTVNPPYDENVVGKCVQRALNAVIVPAYQGPEHTLKWDIDLTGGKKSGPADVAQTE